MGDNLQDDKYGTLSSSAHRHESVRSFMDILARDSPSSRTAQLHRERLRLEHSSGVAYQTATDRRLYMVICRGLPMNPHEVHCLAQFINKTHRRAIDRAEGHRMLVEL
jgi:hypothetical protein